MDILPAGNLIDWSFAGVPGGIPNRTAIAATLNPGASVTQIQAALDACPFGSVVLLKAGTYNLSAGLRMSSSGVTLRGEVDSNGKPSTVLNVTGGNWAQIDISNAGYPQNNWAAVSSQTAPGLTRGSTSCTLGGAPTGLQVGQIAIFDQLDDGTNVQGQGTQGCGVGRDGVRSLIQAVRIKTITGSQVTFEPAIYSSYWNNARSPGLYWWGSGDSQTVRDTGIENLQVIRTPGASNNVSIGPAQRCWAKNIYSQQAASSHIKLGWCLQCEVRDSYLTLFDDVGSAAYATWVTDSSACKIENNVMYNIPCALGMQCVSGCVIGYNYGVLFPYSQPNWLPECMMLHGAHINHCLFEGNFIPSFWADFIHGNSSFNTVARNRITGWEQSKTDSTRCVNIAENQWNNVIIGNVLGTDGYHDTYIDNAGLNYKTIFFLIPASQAQTLLKNNYNYVNDAVPGAEAIGADSQQTSYLYPSAPSWFGGLPWPPVDPKNPAQAIPANLPAGYRYLNGKAPNGGSGGGGGGGSNPGGPPFQPITFYDTVPKGGWNPYTGPQEDGPSKYAPQYSGHDQVKTINTAFPYPKPPPEDGPGAAVGYSKIT